MASFATRQMLEVLVIVISLTKSKAKMMAIHLVMIKKSMMAIT